MKKISTGDQIYLRIINDPLHKTNIEFNGVIYSIEDGEYPNLDVLLHLSNGKLLMMRDIGDGDYRIFYGAYRGNLNTWEYINYIPSNQIDLIINNIQYS